MGESQDRQSLWPSVQMPCESSAFFPVHISFIILTLVHCSSTHASILQLSRRLDIELEWLLFVLKHDNVMMKIHIQQIMLVYTPRKLVCKVNMTGAYACVFYVKVDTLFWYISIDNRIS